jgi:hypothetical protein
MPGRIFLLNESEDLVPMDEAPYESEALLQELLAKHPDLLAGDQINNSSPRKWLLVSREMAVPGEENGNGRWSLDHLFLDQEGIPTLVEVKRSSDTRIRREVIGQILDYAANAVAYWPLEGIRSAFERRCQDDNRSSEEVLAKFLDSEMTEAEFWQQTKRNLDGKNIRMVIVADQLPSELVRIIEFLNEQMNPAEVLGVEVKQFQGNGVRTLVPRVVGLSESAKQKRSASSGGVQWDEQSFFERLRESKGEQQSDVARRLLVWAKERNLRIWWGKGSALGSFFPIYDNPLGKHFMMGVWSSGTIELQFQHMKSPPFATESKRWELAQRVMEATGITLTREKLTKRPSFSMESLLKRENIEKFLAVFDWMLAEVKKCEGPSNDD